MGAKSRVGRPTKETRRIELRLNAALARELDHEATQRRVSLQEYITDLLLARGQPVAAIEQPAPTESSNAAALANEWL